MNFNGKIKQRINTVKNVLVVGLDTDVGKLPQKFSKDAGGIYEFNKMIIESTSDVACAYKINSAFYEALGWEGMKALEKTRDLIENIPVIYDVKRGDIESTAKAYAKAAFEYFNFDAVTLSPYMGSDAIDPFLNYKDHYAFVVCLSSNESATDFEYHGDPPLYVSVARSVATKNSINGNCGLVVGATVAQKLSEISAISPDSLILVPGIGAQQGNIKEVMDSIEHEKLLVNVSRAVIFADDPRSTALNYSKLLSL